MTDLPERLKYLGPFLAHLTTLDPEDIHEDLEVAPLLAVLRKRVSGQSIEDAATLLQDDRDTLDSWLKDNPEHPGHFVAAYLQPRELAEHLVRMPAPKKGAERPKRPASPRFRISLSIPDGFSGSSHKGSYVLLADRMSVVFTPTTAVEQVSAMEQAIAARIAGPRSRVEFTHASGTSYTVYGRTIYHLEIDGRFFDVVIDAPGKSVDPDFVATLVDQAQFR